MSKVMLIFDEPTNCYGCIASSNYMGYCQQEHRKLEEDKYKTKPEWCSLIHVSEEKLPRMTALEFVKSKSDI